MNNNISAPYLAQGISEGLLKDIAAFREKHMVAPDAQNRVEKPEILF